LQQFVTIITISAIHYTGGVHQLLSKAMGVLFNPEKPHNEKHLIYYHLVLIFTVASLAGSVPVMYYSIVRHCLKIL